MEEIMYYMKPELLIVAIVLYFLGVWLKQAAFIRDKSIPLVLGVSGILICGIWIVSTASFSNGQEIADAVFASITQGILAAGLSTYVNQIFKQLRKEE